MSRWMSLGVLATVSLFLSWLYSRTATLVSSMHDNHPQLLLHDKSSTTYHSSSRHKTIRHVRRNKQNPLEIVEERLVEQQETVLLDSKEEEEKDNDFSTIEKEVSEQVPPKQQDTTKIMLNDSSSDEWPMPHLTKESTVILVLSARSHIELRQVIRETWGNGHDNVYFVIGQYCPINTSGRNNKLTCEPFKPTKQEQQTMTTMNTTRHDEWYQKRMTLETTILLQEQEHYRDMLWTPSPESYRGLPHKLKEGYHWVISNLPHVQWIVKADDDTVVRVGAVGTYLSTLSDSHKPTIIGKIEYQGIVHKDGKWKEDQYPHEYYPPFPLGSCGHAVSRPIAEYISTHKNHLFEYQGEDTSLAIWMHQSPMKHTVQILHSDTFENNGNCENPNLFIIGHDLSIAKIQSCFKIGDEVQPILRKWTSQNNK